MVMRNGWIRACPAQDLLLVGHNPRFALLDPGAGESGFSDYLQVHLGRNRTLSFVVPPSDAGDRQRWHERRSQSHTGHTRAYCCLLYTSDAADDLLCVDLGGRRIIKKKKKKKKKKK